jgi:hypothetical protein
MGNEKEIPVTLEKRPSGFEYSSLYPPTDGIQRKPSPPSPIRRKYMRDKKNFHILSLVPQDAIPVMEDGKLAFRECVIDARTGGLKRGYPKFKVGRVFPGEL